MTCKAIRAVQVAFEPPYKGQARIMKSIAGEAGKHKSSVVWIAVNAAFAVILFSAIWWRIAWLQYIVTSFVFTMLLAYATALYEIYVRRTRGPAEQLVPGYVTFAVDIAFLAAMLSEEWYLTASAYAISSILLYLAGRKNFNSEDVPTSLEHNDSTKLKVPQRSGNRWA